VDIPLFSRFFKPSQPVIRPKDFTPLLEYARSHALRTFSNTLICRHNWRSTVPFLLFDARRGLFLFDAVPWDFATLRRAKAANAPRDPNAPRDVSVDAPHQLIRRLLDEADDTRLCPVGSFLYLPNLDAGALEALDPSFGRLLPASRVIFRDDTQEEIHAKLSAALPYRDRSLEAQEILAALFRHYVCHPDALRREAAFPTAAQVAYLEADLGRRSRLVGGYGSGKSTLLLRKALQERLAHPRRRIVITAPTTVACELMTRELLILIDHAMLPVDPTSIRIMTPEQLVDEHYLKCHGHPSHPRGQVTQKMIKRPGLFPAETLYCDDAQLLSAHYRDYFAQQLQEGRLHLALTDAGETQGEHYRLPHRFRSPYSVAQSDSGLLSEQLQRLDGNAYIHTLLLLRRLLEEVQGVEILVVAPDDSFAAALAEEIEGYIGCDLQLLDPHKSLLNQDMGQLLIAGADDISGLQRRHVIVIDDGTLGARRRTHALCRAGCHAYLISHQSE